MKLIAENVAGNLHDACRYVNTGKLAEFVIHMESLSGRNSIVVLRVPDDFDMDKHWSKHWSKSPPGIL